MTQILVKDLGHFQVKESYEEVYDKLNNTDDWIEFAVDTSYGGVLTGKKVISEIRRVVNKHWIISFDKPKPTDK